MYLSKNFTLEELTSSATARLKGIANTPGNKEKDNLKRLCLEILQPIRNVYGAPIIITSGFRSVALNKAVRGSASSQHLKGEAADLISTDNKRLWDTICALIVSGKIRVGQLIDEKNLSWIHISLPDERHVNQILHL